MYIEFEGGLCAQLSVKLINRCFVGDGHFFGAEGGHILKCGCCVPK